VFRPATPAGVCIITATHHAEALAGEISGQWHDGIGWRWHRAANDIGAPAMAKQSSGINPLTEQSSEATPLAARPITPTALAVHDLVCYGIGSLIDSRDAREQMAFAVSVAEWLKVHHVTDEVVMGTCRGCNHIIAAHAVDSRFCVCVRACAHAR
jgi:hypothetical protein